MKKFILFLLSLSLSGIVTAHRDSEITLYNKTDYQLFIQYQICPILLTTPREDCFEEINEATIGNQSFIKILAPYYYEINISHVIAKHPSGKTIDVDFKDGLCAGFDTSPAYLLMSDENSIICTNHLEYL